MRKSLILLAFCFLVTAVAADNDPFPRPKETAAAWQAQEKDLTEVSDVPRFTGAYVWRSRADKNYLAFHQWELRVQAGRQPAPGTKLRVVVLGADMKPTPRGTGPWKSLGDLAAEAEADCSYKMNTNRPVCYRVELTWRGGQERYLAVDPTALPVIEGPAESGPRLLMLQPSFDNLRGGRLAVSFMLRNDGGVAAKDVEITVNFLDEKGKVVHSLKHVPEDGTVPPGYAKVQQLMLKKSPKFKTLGLSAKVGNEATGGGVALDPGAFTDAKTLEIAELRLEEGKLKATLRNGLPEAIGCVQVSLQLLGADDKELELVQLEVRDLKAGEKRPLAAEVGELTGVVGWGVGFQMADEGGAGGNGPAAPQTLVTDADGVKLEVLDVKATKAGVKLRVKVTNNTGKDIEGLVCDLTLSDGKQEQQTKVSCGDLKAGGSYEGAAVGLGLKRLGGIGMGWRGGVTQE